MAQFIPVIADSDHCSNNIVHLVRIGKQQPLWQPDRLTTRLFGIRAMSGARERTLKLLNHRRETAPIVAAEHIEHSLLFPRIPLWPAGPGTGAHR